MNKWGMYCSGCGKQIYLDHDWWIPIRPGQKKEIEFFCDACHKINREVAEKKKKKINETT